MLLEKIWHLQTCLIQGCYKTSICKTMQYLLSSVLWSTIKQGMLVCFSDSEFQFPLCLISCLQGSVSLESPYGFHKTLLLLPTAFTSIKAVHFCPSVLQAGQNIDPQAAWRQVMKLQVWSTLFFPGHWIGPGTDQTATSPKLIGATVS